MADPTAEPPALPPEPAAGPGTVTLSTSLLGDLQVPGTPEQAATLHALAACDAGLANPEGYSGHSLRAGLATAAGEAGADLAAVMRQTRHRSAEVALSYLRTAELWRNDALQKVWDCAREKSEETR